MPRPTKISKFPPAAVAEALERLGRNIRTARLRRKLPQADLAQRMGVSRFVVADIGKGQTDNRRCRLHGCVVGSGPAWPHARRRGPGP